MRMSSVTFCYQFVKSNLTCFSTRNKSFSGGQLNRANNQYFEHLSLLHHHSGCEE
jgi:hypothetical protein